MLYVYCALLAAYLPVWIVLLIRLIYEQTTTALQHATEIGLLIVLINSSVNPGLYLWRIREIRKASFDLLRRLSWRRTTVERIGSRSRNSDRSDAFSLQLELRIQHMEIGLENNATNDSSVNGLTNIHDVFTTQF